MIKYSDNSKKFIKKLARTHGQFEHAAANTLNNAAEFVHKEYDKGIERDFILRDERFTKGAIKVVKANYVRKGGDIRPISRINAIVGVRKMKGGKEHYLAKQEEGATVQGSLEGKVPVPLDQARVGGSHTKKIKPGYRLNRAKPQTLTLAGKQFGHNDSFTTRQRWGILYETYTGRYKTKKGTKIHKTINRYGWDLTKPFIFTGMKRGLGVFAQTGKNRIHWIRSLSESQVRIHSHRTMEKATKKLTEGKMDALFISEARKLVR